jgi:hypothetical protein
MKIYLPNIELKPFGQQLASRPTTLDGKTIGFMDGWAHRLEDGTYTMYPLMREMLDELQNRYDIAGHFWMKKASISQPVTDPVLGEFLSKVDVVINGEAA